MLYLTPEQVSAVTKAKLSNVAACWPPVCLALDVQGINHPLVQVGMAATIAIETGDFTPKREALSKDTGSVLYAAQRRYWPSGYYGRGFIQLTWEANYRAASQALKVDLVADPDMALKPGVAAAIAAWFFRTHQVGGDDKRVLHEACRAGDWEAVRRGINGPGYHKDRAALARFMGHCEGLAKLVEAFNG